MKLSAITLKLGRTVLTAKKQSPHIFFGLGVIGVVGSAILACRATLKLSETLDEIENDIKEVKELKEVGAAVQTKYPAEEWNKDAVYVYVKGGLKLAKLYAPAVVIGAASIACLTGSHIQLTRRNSALMAAYTALHSAYEEYRERVREQLGEDKERELYHGIKTEVVKEDGKNKEVKVIDPKAPSPYAKMFDEYSVNWKRDPELNRIFLQCQQEYANQLLRTRGHVFLNEIYDLLDVGRTRAGAVVGWVYQGSGDNYVDFGMFDCESSRFVNGWERSILLDFNVDGVIYDKI